VPQWTANVAVGSNSEVELADADFRFAPDIVEKVFFGRRTKFSKIADAFRALRREGPHCFAQKRPPTIVSALRSAAAVERA
jgi:hypothetical protein